MPLLLAWSVWWLAFFPGVLSHDVMSQWQEILAGRFGDEHPAAHTFTIWLITRVWPSLAAVSAVHLVLTAALAGLLLGIARDRGAPGWLVGFAAGWLALAPVFPMHAIAAERDAAFGVAVLWTTALLVPVAADGSISTGRAISLGVALAAVWLLRHNGPALAVPVLAALAALFRRTARRAVGVVMVVCVGLVAVVKGPLYRTAGVVPPSPVYRQYLFIHQVAALVKAGTPLSEEDARFLSSVMPLRTWQSAYVCETSDPLLFSAPLQAEALAREPLALPGIWARLARRNPRALLRHWRCVTRFIRSVHSPLWKGPLRPDGSTVAPNPFGLAADSKLPAVRVLLARIVRRTFEPHSPLRAVIWQPALPLYLLVGAFGVALWRAGSAAPLLVWLPGLCNTLVWLVAAPAPHLRYQWPVVLLAPLLGCVAWIRWRDPVPPLAR